jgi:hypothetical protein
MKKIFALVSSLVLVLALAAPLAAFGQDWYWNYPYYYYNNSYYSPYTYSSAYNYPYSYNYNNYNGYYGNGYYGSYYNSVSGSVITATPNVLVLRGDDGRTYVAQLLASVNSGYGLGRGARVVVYGNLQGNVIFARYVNSFPF